MKNKEGKDKNRKSDNVHIVLTHNASETRLKGEVHPMSYTNIPQHQANNQAQEKLLLDEISIAESTKMQSCQAPNVHIMHVPEATMVQLDQ